MSNIERKELYQLHKEGKSYKDLAEMFQVNKNTVASIIKKMEEKVF